ncbi:MAG TPA: BolA family protein [Methylotenera sp.]|nr:BolA family protein [Methylotenera sp.]
MTLHQEITTRLQIMDPVSLELIDESALHAGHTGNTGGGHFKLKMTSSHFCGKSQIMRHRLIYQLLSDLIPNKIHALSIQALATDESSTEY